MSKYRSCKWVEHGMVLDYCNVIRSCNNFNPGKGGRPVLYENYQGEKIDWVDFFKKQNVLREQFKTGGCVSECENCIGFEDKEWDSENYINILLLTPWYKCNSNCIYCSAPNDEYVKANTKPYSVVAVVKDMIANNILKKDAVIDIAGGEPTIYSEFDELLSILLNNDFTKIVIHTNAIIYNPLITRGIVEDKVKMVVSIDAGSKDTHKKVKGVDSFDAVWENFAKYAKAQVAPYSSVKSKYIIVPGVNDSEEEIKTWLEKSQAIGIKNVILNLDFNWLMSNVNSELIKLYDLMQYTISEAEKLGIFCELYGQIFQVKTIIENKVEYNKAGFFEENAKT